MILQEMSITAYHRVHIVHSMSRVAQSTSRLSVGMKKYIPPSFQERVKQGRITAIELEKLFAPTKTEIMYIEKALSKGFVGYILNLEGCLVDTTEIFGYAYTLIAEDLGQPKPDYKHIRDILGLTFHDAAASLGWEIPKEDILLLEQKFHFIMDKLLKKDPDVLPVRAIPGAAELLDGIINDGNDVTILTNLPQELAVRFLSRAGLSEYLEGRVPPDCLICSEARVLPARTHFNIDEVGKGTGTASAEQVKTAEQWGEAVDQMYHPRWGDRYFSQQVLKACAVMQKSPLAVVMIESNRRNVVSAKKTGIHCVAIQGYAMNSYFLKGADMVLSHLKDFTLKDGYKMVRKTIDMADGPPQQQMVAPERLRQQKLATSADFADPPAPSTDEQSPEN